MSTAHLTIYDLARFVQLFPIEQFTPGFLKLPRRQRHIGISATRDNRSSTYKRRILSYVQTDTDLSSTTAASSQSSLYGPISSSSLLSSVFSTCNGISQWQKSGFEIIPSNFDESTSSHSMKSEPCILPDTPGSSSAPMSSRPLSQGSLPPSSVLPVLPSQPPSTATTVSSHKYYKTVLHYGQSPNFCLQKSLSPALDASSVFDLLITPRSSSLSHYSSPHASSSSECLKQEVFTVAQKDDPLRHEKKDRRGTVVPVTYRPTISGGHLCSYVQPTSPTTKCQSPKLSTQSPKAFHRRQRPIAALLRPRNLIRRASSFNHSLKCSAATGSILGWTLRKRL